MFVNLSTKLGRSISDEAHQFATLSDVGRIYFDGNYPDYPGLSESLRVYDDSFGFGEWYLMGGYCMHWAMIRADSFDDAYDIYLTEFVSSEEPEDEDEAECVEYDSCGGWHSESTTSYICSVPIAHADAIIVEWLAD